MVENLPSVYGLPKMSETIQGNYMVVWLLYVDNKDRPDCADHRLIQVFAGCTFLKVYYLLL